jgi:preprotein translocase subunit SecE
VAEKRQRSKQRQAERRAQRLAERGDGGARPGQPPVEPEQADPDREPAEAEEQYDLAVGAPPRDLGTSEFTTRHEEPPAPDFEGDDEDLVDDGGGAAPPTRGPRGVRGGGDGEGGRGASGAEHKERGRLLEFLKAVVAELKRVQWPDRKHLTQLTGVVLFFVVIIGAYLGALDAIFSKLIQSIL